jgi:hypothetical protein
LGKIRTKPNVSVATKSILRTKARSRLVLERVLLAAVMMTNSLQSLFEAIADASNEQELRLHVMVKISDYFVAQRRKLFLFHVVLSW